MADYNDEIVEGGSGADVEMDGADEEANGRVLPFAEEGPDDPDKPRSSFISYLTSPVVTLMVGTGDSGTVLTAHQALLMSSPFFGAACADFADDGSVSGPPLPLHLAVARPS